MKNSLLILMIVIFLISCENKKTDSDQQLQNKVIDSTALFINLFPEINSVDLHIYSPKEYDTLNNDRFVGKQINTCFYKYLKTKHYDPLSIDTSYHLYSCYRFKLSETKLGLIVRRPSQYSETAIDLFSWDILKKQVVDITNLTDAFGDEGWHFVQDAWMKDLNNDQQLDIITRRKDYDQDLGDTTKISKTDSIYVLLNNGTTFIKTKRNIDTSNFKLMYWNAE